MAKVKIEGVVYHLDREFKAALEDAVKQVIPGAAFDRNALYKAFEKAIYRKCSVWENVPDNLVEKS
jgi:hypothetical protein